MEIYGKQYFSKKYYKCFEKSMIYSYSIRNKFGDLDKIVDGNINIFCIAETKLDLLPIISS